MATEHPQVRIKMQSAKENQKHERNDLMQVNNDQFGRKMSFARSSATDLIHDASFLQDPPRTNTPPILNSNNTDRRSPITIEGVINQHEVYLFRQEIVIVDGVSAAPTATHDLEA